MIEKLDKYSTSSTYAIIDKINEIIDFLNDTYLMRQKDAKYISIADGSDCVYVPGVCTDALPFITGLSMVDDTAQSDLEFVTTVTSDIKCPHCGESFYTETSSWTTLAGYPPIYKDGVNINPDQNKSVTHCKCLKCNKEFDI